MSDKSRSSQQANNLLTQDMLRLDTDSTNMSEDGLFSLPSPVKILAKKSGEDNSGDPPGGSGGSSGGSGEDKQVQIV